MHRNSSERQIWRRRTRHSGAGLEHRHLSVKHFVPENLRERGLRRLLRDIRFEPGHDGEPPERNVVLAVSPMARIAHARRVCKRNPDIEVAAGRNSVEALFGDANDGEGHTVQFDRAANHIARAAKGALPVAEVEDDDGGCRRQIVARLKEASGSRFDAEGAEKISRGELASNDAGRAVSREIEGPGIRKCSYP